MCFMLLNFILQENEEGIKISKRKVLNMAYYITLYMYSSTKIERDDVISVYCLLEMYLENESNNCRVEYGDVSVMKTPSIHERVEYFVEYKITLAARNIMNSITGMIEQQTRQNNLNVTFQMRVMDSDNKDAQRVFSLSTQHKGDISQTKDPGKMQLIFNRGFRPLNSEYLCREYTSSPVPQTQCTHIGVEVISRADDVTVAWNCSRSDDTTYLSYRAGQQSTHTLEFGIYGLILVLLGYW